MNLLAAAEDAPTPLPTSSAVLVVRVETTDAQLLELWLHGKARQVSAACEHYRAGATHDFALDESDRAAGCLKRRSGAGGRRLNELALARTS